jgi:hypothetical protein
MIWPFDWSSQPWRELQFILQRKKIFKDGSMTGDLGIDTENYENYFVLYNQVYFWKSIKSSSIVSPQYPKLSTILEKKHVFG